MGILPAEDGSASLVGDVGLPRARLPVGEHLQLRRYVLTRRCALSPAGLGRQWGRASQQKPCSKRVRWAREELNLRPLPCQIQRAAVGMNVGRLEAGKDHRKAAAERRRQHPSPPTIRHDSPTVVPVPTTVGCCPSAAQHLQLRCRPLGPISDLQAQPRASLRIPTLESVWCPDLSRPLVAMTSADA
jgi:hypothetical protein